MKQTLRKTVAVIEVSCVAFGLTPLLTWLLYRLFPQVKTWQVQVGFNVPALFYVLSAATPVFIALLRGKSPAAYGIDFHNVKYHLDVMLTCFLPIALASTLNAIFPANSWMGMPVQIAANMALLFALAWLLRKKPTLQAVAGSAAGMLAAGLIWLPGMAGGIDPSTKKAVVLFLNYALFVGFGEEILFRGYIESRLNETFGQPFRFSGVCFGWGVLITNLLFGLMHIGVIRWILGINYEVTLAWGCWTIFSGLVFSFVREKTGSIFAPALLHGLPQAIAAIAMLFIQL